MRFDLTREESSVIDADPANIGSASASLIDVPIADCELASPLRATRYSNRAVADSTCSDGPPAVGGRALRVMFLLTDMRIGGAEMLTANIIRRLDRRRFAPELCCLKTLGALGEELSNEIPTHYGLTRNKYDVRVLQRLVALLRRRQIDALVTVGAGDKMFWGRLAARRARVPVVVSALHSTGWPDDIGRLNRLLTPLTDAFIAVADSHGRYLIEHERMPGQKVAVIRNGVDTARFSPANSPESVRRELGINSTDPIVGIVAALRPEKNHELFLEMAGRVVAHLPAARFLIVGDGPCRARLEAHARSLGLTSHVHFLGARSDVPAVLAAMDVFVLTSHIEANPVSILEAMSTGRPVVATNVGSIHEVISEGETGYLVRPGEAAQLSDRVLQLLHAPLLGHAMGLAARESVVRDWSLAATVRGYEQLIEAIFMRKSSAEQTTVAGR